MIQVTKNILDTITKDKLNNICNTFNHSDYKNIDYNLDNNYVRLFIDNALLKNYLQNSIEFVNKSIDDGIIVDFNNTTSWINKITIDTNKRDIFHKDISNLTLITYLNNEFQGGNFEYIDINNVKHIIKPEVDMTILIGNRLPHRVTNLTYGTRFSLITFINFKEKQNKKLI